MNIFINSIAADSAYFSSQIEAWNFVFSLDEEKRSFLIKGSLDPYSKRAAGNRVKVYVKPVTQNS